MCVYLGISMKNPLGFLGKPPQAIATPHAIERSRPAPHECSWCSKSTARSRSRGTMQVPPALWGALGISAIFLEILRDF